MKRNNPSKEKAESSTRSVRSSEGLPGLFFLSAFPREEIWRLFVDGSLWSKENGWQGYESREPGSLSAALESLCSIALELNESNKEFELSVELIKKIHKKCGRNVKKLENKKPGETRPKGMEVSFGIKAGNASIKGIKEFLSLDFLVEGKAEFGPGKINPFGTIIEFNYFENLTQEKITPQLAEKIYSEMQKGQYTYFYCVRENVDVYLEAITCSYNKEIKDAKTLDEKLYVIVKHIRQYEVLHPFRDANGRTFVNNLLNILLMQHGLPPATFYEPNVFDLYSADELVVVVKEAIFNTINIIEKSNNNKPILLYGYRASLEDKNKFKDILDSSSYDDLKKIDFSSLDIKKLQDDTRKCLSALDKENPLHRAAFYVWDPKKIKSVVSINNSDINKRVEQGAPPLYVGRVPIHLAIMTGNIAMIDELIVNSANLSIQDYNGKTALHYAAEYGDVEIMVKLLKALKETGTLDALKIKDNKGSLPITLAYKNNKLDIFDELLNSGANISEELLAEISKRKDEETLIKIVNKNKEILLNKGSKDNIEVFKTVISFGNIPLVKQFLQAGWNLDLELNKNKETPLMVAFSQGNIKLANYLLEKGANTKLTDKDGDSILIRTISIYTNNIHTKELLRLITDKDNSLLNTPNNNEQTPLYAAAMGHHLTLVKFILDKGAKVNIKVKGENNLLHELMYDGDLSILEEIINRDRKLLHEKNSQERNPFHQGLDSVSEYSKTAEMRFIELSKFLFKEKVDLNAKDTSDKTILDLALSKQFFKLSTQLIQEGALTNISLPSQFLERSVAAEILESHTNFKKRLGKTLDKNPVIAMAQLNDLYLKIRDNLIKTPKGFTQELSCFSIFKRKTDESKAHDAVLSILKEIYDDKLKQVPKFYQEKGKKRYNEIQQDLELLIDSMIGFEPYPINNALSG